MEYTFTVSALYRSGYEILAPNKNVVETYVGDQIKVRIRQFATEELANRVAQIRKAAHDAELYSFGHEGLNSEGGLCYQPTALDRIRIGRPKDEGDDGGNAIGEYDFHSPVGEPLIILLFLAAIYAVARNYKRQKGYKREAIHAQQ